MNYREPLFRPPAEAESLIFQVAYGCPHNTCRFCGMYKTVKYQLRNENEVLAEIREAADTKTINELKNLIKEKVPEYSAQIYE